MNRDRVIQALAWRLEAKANPKTRAHWESYLKGAIPFRGVPMAGIRDAVHDCWWEDGPMDSPRQEQMAFALALFQGTFAEDKLAGTLALREILFPGLGLADLPRLGALFDAGLIADWGTCDWFCVKVLGPLVAHHLPRRQLADEIAAWRDAESLWKRRASNVAFVNLAKRGDLNFPGFTALMLETCAVTVRSPERFAQTGVGWLLRELAKADPDPVLVFTRAHLGLMSREGVRYVVERMSKDVQSAILEEHSALNSSRRPPRITPTAPLRAAMARPSLPPPMA